MTSPNIVKKAETDASTVRRWVLSSFQSSHYDVW